MLADALMRELGLVDTPSGLLALAPIPAADGPLTWRPMPSCSMACRIRQRRHAVAHGCSGRGSPGLAVARLCRGVVAESPARRAGAHFVLAIHEEADLEVLPPLIAARWR